ncbi:sulfotransferase family protein [Methylovirgula sp. 4M-Z18]|uniref:sulfotransferase family protein n=1 Tax=Methylovirgula sp. 4M-Z18 TaxID=2293567 RepID=UPI000E2E6E0E|nr:sulfotransferase family protein [Methylovirgula sp. 4M-Z18]RFB75023.1 hypothetical protein DYH55_22670 [Methylovirgula sp. 4M-Z18]
MLEVIGPGFGRTGTMSLKAALEILGLGPCHHMDEVFKNPHQVPYWQALAAGEPVVWDDVFSGYRAQVDWPGAHPWRDLAAAYPKAKVVLTVRPEEAWWKSFSSTIAALATAPERDRLPPHIKAMGDVVFEFIMKQTFGCPLSDHDGALRAYRQRIDDVRSAIAPDRLLVFDVREGWAPLCRFLDKPVPGVPFPRTNSQEEFWQLVRGGP